MEARTCLCMGCLSTRRSLPPPPPTRPPRCERMCAALLAPHAGSEAAAEACWACHSRNTPPKPSQHGAPLSTWCSRGPSTNLKPKSAGPPAWPPELRPSQTFYPMCRRRFICFAKPKECPRHYLAATRTCSVGHFFYRTPRVLFHSLPVSCHSFHCWRHHQVPPTPHSCPVAAHLLDPRCPLAPAPSSTRHALQSPSRSLL